MASAPILFNPYDTTTKDILVKQRRQQFLNSFMQRQQQLPQQPPPPLVNFGFQPTVNPAAPVYMPNPSNTDERSRHKRHKKHRHHRHDREPGIDELSHHLEMSKTYHQQLDSAAAQQPSIEQQQVAAMLQQQQQQAAAAAAAEQVVSRVLSIDLNPDVVQSSLLKPPATEIQNQVANFEPESPAVVVIQSAAAAAKNDQRPTTDKRLQRQVLDITATHAYKMTTDASANEIDDEVPRWSMIYEETAMALLSLARSRIMIICQMPSTSSNGGAMMPRITSGSPILSELEHMLRMLSNTTAGSIDKLDVQRESIVTLERELIVAQKEQFAALNGFEMKARRLSENVHAAEQKLYLMSVIGAHRGIAEWHNYWAAAKSSRISDVRSSTETTLHLFIDGLIDVVERQVFREVIAVLQYQQDYTTKLNEHFKPSAVAHDQRPFLVSQATGGNNERQALLHEYIHFLGSVLEKQMKPADHPLIKLSKATRETITAELASTARPSDEMLQDLISCSVSDIQYALDQAILKAQQKPITAADAVIINDRRNFMALEYKFAMTKQQLDQARIISEATSARLITAWSTSSCNWAQLNELHLQQQNAAHNVRSAERLLADLRQQLASFTTSSQHHETPKSSVGSSITDLMSIRDKHYSKFMARVVAPPIVEDSNENETKLVIPADLFHRFNDIIEASTDQAVKMLQMDGLRKIEALAGRLKTEYNHKATELRDTWGQLKQVLDARKGTLETMLFEQKHHLVRVYDIQDPRFVDMEKTAELYSSLCMKSAAAAQRLENLKSAISLYMRVSNLNASKPFAAAPVVVFSNATKDVEDPKKLEPQQ